MKLSQTKFLIFISFFFTPFFLMAQFGESLIPFEQDGLWGYMNLEKNIVVEAKFTEAYPIIYGRGRVKYKEKYGFVNRAGEIVIKAKYKEAEDFTMNGSNVIKGKKQLRIDTLGEINRSWLMACGFGSDCIDLMPLRSHPIIKKGNLYGLQLRKEVVQSNGQVELLLDTLEIEYDSIFPLYYGMICFKKNGKYGLIDRSIFQLGAKKTKELLEIRFEDFLVFPCYEVANGIKNIMALKSNGKWGIVYLNSGWFDFRTKEDKGKYRYESIGSLGRGYLIVEYKPDQFGVIDFMGKEYFRED